MGKKKKTPTNLNGIAEEPSVHSSISNKNEINENIDENNNEEINNDAHESNKEVNINEDSLDQKDINEDQQDIQESKEEEFIENNQGNQIIKELDIEITKVTNKKDLMNKNLSFSVTAIEDDNEQEKINKENLNDILSNLPNTKKLYVYSYKNNNRIKIIFYLKDNMDNEIGK